MDPSTFIITEYFTNLRRFVLPRVRRQFERDLASCVRSDTVHGLLIARLVRNHVRKGDRLPWINLLRAVRRSSSKPAPNQTSALT